MLIDNRFRGFPSIAHGGYAGGLIADALEAPAAEIRFLKPIPVDSPLELAPMPDGRVELRSDDVVHAFGVPADVSLDLPALPTLDEACAAGDGYIGHRKHLFPSCFVCGPDRCAGDGLRIFPGTLPGSATVAGIWTPHPSDGGSDGIVRPELVWAALDCPQLWSLIHAAPADSGDRVVTGALATQLDRPVVAAEPHIVVGWPIAREGRMIIAGGAVLTAEGDVCAISRQTAVATSWGIALGTDHWRVQRDHKPSLVEAA